MKRSKLKKAYNKSKNASVGTACICPSCKTEFIKETYQQAFCKSKGKTVCKDYYWNNVTETKRNNITRLSPANKRFRALNIELNEDYDVEDLEHPFSSEALGQWMD